MSNAFKILFFIMALFNGSLNAVASDDKKILVAVNQYVSHIALDAAHNGLVEGLKKSGKISVISNIAQGSIVNSVQISKKQVGLNPDFMVAISTPSAQTNLKVVNNETFLAFLAVTDPASANLSSHQKLIGVTDVPPIAELIDLSAQIIPNQKTIGVIYNSGEINSIKVVEKLQTELEARGIKLVKAVVNSPADIKIAINKLVDEVESIYLPQDNMVISALDTVVAVSKQKKIPLFANDPTLVERGVLLAVGTNYFESGKQLAQMIVDIIDGKTLSENIQNGKVVELKINAKAAELYNIVMPDTILQDSRLVK